MIVEIQPLQTLDERPSRWRIGLALATDHRLDADFRRLVANDDIAIYVARIPYINLTVPESLRAMHPLLAAASAFILSDGEADAIVYCCTSACVVISEDDVIATVQAGKREIPVITPLARLSVLFGSAVLTFYHPTSGARQSRSAPSSLTAALLSNASCELASKTSVRWHAYRTRSSGWPCPPLRQAQKRFSLPVRRSGPRSVFPKSNGNPACWWSPATWQPRGLSCANGALALTRPLPIDCLPFLPA